MFLYYSFIPDAATLSNTSDYLLISLIFIDKLGVSPMSIFYNVVIVKFSRCLIFVKHFITVNNYSHSCLHILRYTDSYITLVLLTNFHKMTWYLHTLTKLLICITTCVLLIFCAYSASKISLQPSRYPSCNYYNLFKFLYTIVCTKMESLYESIEFWYMYMYLLNVYLSIVFIYVFCCLSLPIFILEYG